MNSVIRHDEHIAIGSAATVFANFFKDRLDSTVCLLISELQVTFVACLLVQILTGCTHRLPGVPMLVGSRKLLA
jgi:hypothetical protein